MSWLNVAGSIGSGISQGIQDMERMDRAKFEKKQQARQQKEWDEEDQLATRLAGIKRTHEAYSDPSVQNFPTRDDDGNVMPGVTQVARPRSQVLAEEAAAYAGVSSPKLRSQGIQLDQHAYTASEQERAAAQRAKSEAIHAELRPHAQTIMSSPKAARDWLVSQGIPLYNNAVPDGQIAGHTLRDDGGLTVTMFDQKTQKPLKQIDVPAEHVQEAAARKLEAQRRRRLGELSDENYLKFILEPDQKTDELKVRQQGADAQTLTAQSNADFHAPGGVWQTAQREANEAHIKAAKIAASTHGILNPLQQEQLTQLQDYSKRTKVFAELLKDPKGNRDAIRQAAVELATYHPDKAVNAVKLRDRDGSEREVTVNKFSLLADQATEGLAPPAAESAFVSGKNPLTGKPLTKAEGMEFLRKYPKSGLTEKDAPWLAKAK